MEDVVMEVRERASLLMDDGDDIDSVSATTVKRSDRIGQGEVLEPGQLTKDEDPIVEMSTLKFVQFFDSSIHSVHLES
jgi:hypothetical protein